MTTLREAATTALETLKKVKTDADKKPPVYPWDAWRVWVDDSITALEAALAEPVQEQPVCDECGKHKRDGWALYCVGCVEPMFSDAAEPAGDLAGGHSVASTNTKSEAQVKRDCPKCSHPMFCAVKCDQCGRVFEDEAEPVQEPMIPKLKPRLLPDDDAAQPQRHLPDWISYDQTTDVLTIHGKKYAAAIFGEEGFLSPIGTVLRVEQSQPETVTLTVVPQRKPLTEEEIGVLEMKYAPPVHPDFSDADDWLDFARAIERARGIGGQE